MQSCRRAILTILVAIGVAPAALAFNQGAMNENADCLAALEELRSGGSVLAEISAQLDALKSLDPPLTPDPLLEADVNEAIEVIAYLVDDRDDHGYDRIIWKDDAPARCGWLEKRLSRGLVSRYALHYRLTEYLNALDLEWPSERKGVSVDEKDPSAADIIPVRSKALRQLVEQLDGASEALRKLGRTCHYGYSLVSPVEPFIPGKGRTRVTVTYGLEPFNRDGGRFESFETGRVDVTVDYSITDWLSVGTALPLVVQAASAERETGFGDMSLGAKFWPNAGGSDFLYGFQLAAVLPTAKEGVASDPTLDDSVGLFTADVRAVWVPIPRNVPRLYAFVGGQWDFEDQLNRNATDVIVGAMWSHDRWREDSAHRFFNVGAWAEVEGKFYYEEQPALFRVPFDSTWDLRVGLSLFRLTQPGHDGEMRHEISGELERRLDSDSRSSTISGALTYGLTF